VAADIVIGEYGGDFVWSPDGGRVAWTAGQEGPGRVWVYSVKTDVARVLPGDRHDGGYGIMKLTFLRGPAVLWLDNKRILPTAYQNDRATPWWQRVPTQLVSLDAERGNVVRRIDVSRHGIASLVGRVRGLIVLVVEDSTHAETFYGVDVNRRQIRPVFRVTSGTVAYDVPNLPMVNHSGTHLYYVGQDFAHPASVYRRSIATGKTEKLLDPNPGLARYALGSSRLLSYRTPTGAARNAALFLPPGWSPGRRVPLVMILYPCMCMSVQVNHFAGDVGGVGDIGSNVHLFTTRGYGVLMPDIEVATGTAVADIQREASAAVDAAIREGYADSTRLGVTGHSYGGYATYALVVHSARFRAAVVQAGLASWTSSYLSIDDKGEGHGLQQAEGSLAGPGKTLWENQRGYITNSPLYFFDRVRTPVLIVHGTVDAAVNQQEARMAFAALRRLGRDAELVLYEGENHGMSDWSISSLRDFGTRLLGWFDRYLCPDRIVGTECPDVPLRRSSTAP
jgi:dienelactone hydrolase